MSLSSLVQEMVWRQVGANPRNSCLILRISLRKIEMSVFSVFSCQFFTGLNVSNNREALLVYIALVY